MVPPSSDRITRVPPYLMCQRCSFVYGAITLYRQTFQTVPLPQHWSAFPLSLAATKGISVDFFSSGYLDVSVLPVRLLHLCIQCKIPLTRWVSPFRHVRITARLPAPLTFSQAPTSFIASNCQGIRRVRLVTWPYNSDDWLSSDLYGLMTDRLNLNMILYMLNAYKTCNDNLPDKHLRFWLSKLLSR